MSNGPNLLLALCSKAILMYFPCMELDTYVPNNPQKTVSLKHGQIPILPRYQG